MGYNELLEGSTRMQTCGNHCMACEKNQLYFRLQGRLRFFLPVAGR